jgi:uncharacterized protein (DUF885 family)
MTVRPLPLALAAALAAPLFGGCHNPPPGTVKDSPAEESERSAENPTASRAKGFAWEDAAAGVNDPALAQLCTDVWEDWMASFPTWATYLGDPRHHGELTDNSPAGIDARAARTRDFLRRHARIDAAQLDSTDRVTWALLGEDLDWTLERIDLDLVSWNLSARGGPQVDFLSLAADQPIGTWEERRQFVERWKLMDGRIRQQSYHLQRGLRYDRVASHKAVSDVIAELDAILDTHPMDSPLVEPALGGGTWVHLGPDDTLSRIAFEHLGDATRADELSHLNQHLQDGPTLARGTRVLIPAKDDPLNMRERGRFLAAVLTTVDDRIYPAYGEYRRVLSEKILPAARGDDRPGLVWLDGTGATYAALARHHTGLDLTPQEIHDIGLEEVGLVRAEIEELGGSTLGVSTIAELRARLEGDPDLHFRTRTEVEVAAREAVARAEAALPAWFDRLPGSSCEVVRIPPHEEERTTIAYYRGPAADGSRPGRYYVNTFRPHTRTRFDAEVLAFHEAVPGHHLQIALAQELGDLPLVRRHGGSTAFVEGWALYTERLSDEMGLYTGDLDRLGMLSFDAWRAARLVVDTGIHQLGWTRSDAVRYLTENTLLTTDNIENEVDRYIATPGQALAYKLGQREILALRAEARERLGASFDIAEFHDRVLGQGAVPLGVLRAQIEQWLDEVAGPAVAAIDASAPVATPAEPAEPTPAPGD